MGKEVYHDTGDDGQTNVLTDTWQAQTFKTGGAFTLSVISLKAYRSGTPGTITVGIRALDGDIVTSKPTGSDLTSGTFDADILPTASANAAWVNVVLTNYDLSANTRYAIVIHNSPANTLYLRQDTDSGYANGGVTTSTDGTTWGAVNATNDLMFRIWGTGGILPSADSYVTKNWVAIAANELWYESAAGTMSQLAASVGDMDTSAQMSVFELYGKVFICNDAYKKVFDPTNTKITTTDLNTHAPDFHTVLTGGTSEAKMVVDYITSTTADAACTIYGKRITTATFENLETVTGKDDDDNDITFVLSAAETAPPHWYDYTVYGNDTTFGSLPDQMNLGCNWRGRGVYSGDKDYPGQWYMARQSNPWDLNYIANDAQSPVAGGNADAGECGDTILAVISYSRDYLIFGCANSLWVMAGDPAENGSLYEFYSTGGILSAWSWCWDKEGNLYILSSAGLLKIAPGFGTVENITEESYPDFIKDLAYNKATYKLTMGYDRKQHGIEIARTTLTSGANSCWWYDLKTDGLFPDSFPTACGIFSVAYYEASDPDYQHLLFGCNDGYIRFADGAVKNDSATGDTLGSPSTLIDSYVTFGPLEIAGENREGKITSLIGVTTGGKTGGTVTDSNDLTYKLWTGLSADEIVEKLAANTVPNVAGTISAPGRGRGARKRKSVRGAYAGIRIGNATASQTWGLEKLIIEAREGGRIK